jgi:hypothetical protein
MRYCLLIIILYSSFIFGQSQRLVLFEEFTQASCGPCEEMNPALNRMLNERPDKVVSIKYQTYFPGIDPMNGHNPVQVDNRVDFYSIAGVPYGKLDGGIGFSGIPDGLDTNDINSRYYLPSPFIINVSFTINSLNDTIFAHSDITCTQAVSGSLTAHMAIIERDVYFSESPGTNDETHFEGVMKYMLPTAFGTPLQPTWMPGDTLDLDYFWKLANVYDINQLAVVVFIQDTLTKEVLQAGYAHPHIISDVGIISVTGILPLSCTNTFIPQLEIRNHSTNILTSLNVNYKLDSVVVQTFPWNGNVPADLYQLISLPSITIPDGGHLLTFETVSPNGITDQVPLNDTINSPAVISTSTVSLPYSESFLSASFPVNGIAVYDSAADAHHWQYSAVGSTNSGSALMNVYDSEVFGAHDYMYLPRFNFSNSVVPVNLTFDVAYASYNSSLADDLDIDVSTDCGMSWTNVFSKGGNTLATAPSTTSAFIPTSAQWRNEIVSLDSYSGMPDVLVRFDVLERRGNNLYVDNINVTDALTKVDDIKKNNISVYPQPADKLLNLELSLSGDEILVTITNICGQIVYSQNISASEIIQLNTGVIDNGLYNLILKTDDELYNTRILIQHAD